MSKSIIMDLVLDAWFATPEYAALEVTSESRAAAAAEDALNFICDFLLENRDFKESVEDYEAACRATPEYAALETAIAAHHATPEWAAARETPAGMLVDYLQNEG